MFISSNSILTVLPRIFITHLCWLARRNTRYCITLMWTWMGRGRAPHVSLRGDSSVEEREHLWAVGDSLSAAYNIATAVSKEAQYEMRKKPSTTETTTSLYSGFKPRRSNSGKHNTTVDESRAKESVTDLAIQCVQEGQFNLTRCWKNEYQFDH